MIEIKIACTSREKGSIELLRHILINLGVAEDEIVEKEEKGRKSLSFFTAAYARALKQKKKIISLRLKGAYVSLKVLKDSDWKTRWKKYFKPFNITGDIRIVPLWKKKEEERKAGPKGCQRIFIDTTFAFGTGMHATTQMMAALIQSKRGRFRSFFDIGTGSGILSLIAFQYGASDIWAIDFDKEAIMTARRNFSLNQRSVRYAKAVSLEKFRVRHNFDFVAANLLTDDLVRLKGKIISCVRKGGYVAVSGIYQENAADFSRFFKDSRLRCIRVLRRKKWHAFLFKKKT